jgi:hypothetical protein
MPNPTEERAMKIVEDEEHAKGRKTRRLGSLEQKQYGCDIISTLPDGSDPHYIEVKGWGRSFLTPGRKWSWAHEEVRQSQIEASLRDRSSSHRFEIWANLDAYHDGRAAYYERLTLTAGYVRDRMEERVQHLLVLEDSLKDEIRPSDLL